MRQEFVERWIEQTHGDRQVVHRLENAFEVLPLERKQFLQSGSPSRFIFRENHGSHVDDSIRLKEHVLGSAQADTFGTEVPCLLAVLGRVGVRANRHRSILVRPFHELGEITGQLGVLRFNRTQHDFTRCAIQTDDIFGTQRFAVDFDLLRLFVDLNIACTRNAAFAPTSGNNCRVAGRTARAGQNSNSSAHAVDIFRARFSTNQNDALASIFSFSCFFRSERQFSNRSTWGSVDAATKDVGLAASCRVKAWQQQLSQCVGWHS